jgi:hypothetical protein
MSVCYCVCRSRESLARRRFTPSAHVCVYIATPCVRDLDIQVLPSLACSAVSCKSGVWLPRSIEVAIRDVGLQRLT